MGTIRTRIYVLFRCPEDDEEYVVSPFSTLDRAKARAISHWEEMVGRGDDPRPSEFTWQEVEAGWISNADSTDRVEREYRIESWAMDEEEDGPEAPSGWQARQKLLEIEREVADRGIDGTGLVDAVLDGICGAKVRAVAALCRDDDLAAGRELHALQALLDCGLAAAGG